MPMVCEEHYQGRYQAKEDNVSYLVLVHEQQPSQMQ